MHVEKACGISSRFSLSRNHLNDFSLLLWPELRMATADAPLPASAFQTLTMAVPPRVVALSSMGANRTGGLGMITALSLLEQGLRSLTSPVAFVRAGGFFENFLYGLQAAQGGTLPVFYNPTNQ